MLKRLPRLEPALQLVCALLVIVVLFQFSRLVHRRNSFARAGDFAGIFAGAKPAATNARAALPPEIAARIDKIKESQVLGMVMRPPPMALIGIAGGDVLLRGPNGQTGILREGESLAGVKLLRVGTNRVLVEHEGREKELILFDGFGSESLLSKGKETNK
jgi:hypothetical protein